MADAGSPFRLTPGWRGLVVVFLRPMVDHQGLDTRSSLTMTQPSTDNSLTRLVDEQLDLAASMLPAMEPSAVHPSPVDHEERQDAHPTLEDVLLGHAQPTPEMLQELAALESAPPLTDEELARQALADGGADNDPSTPE